jgi:DNA-binding MarR family transcriptional regulator
MEKSGFVNRKPVKNDRRINLIYLTEMGKQLQEELITQAIKTLLAAGKGIKKSDMEICKSVLRKVYNNLKD